MPGSVPRRAHNCACVRGYETVRIGIRRGGSVGPEHVAAHALVMASMSSSGAAWRRQIQRPMTLRAIGLRVSRSHMAQRIYRGLLIDANLAAAEGRRTSRRADARRTRAGRSGIGASSSQGDVRRIGCTCSSGPYDAFRTERTSDWDRTHRRASASRSLRIGSSSPTSQRTKRP